MRALHRSVVPVCLLLTAAGLSLPRAGVAPYRDRAAWEAALGGPPSFLVDFNGFVADVGLDPPLDLGPFVMQHNGGLQADGRSKVDADPFEFGSSVDGTPGVEVYLQADLFTVDLLFPTPIFAFGADWQFAGNSSSPLRISGYDSADVLLFTFSLNEPTRTVFFGFTSDPPEAIARIRLSNPINDGLRIDNVGGAIVPGGGGPPDPLDLLQDLKDQVAALGLHHGIENALLSKLQAATLLLVDMVPGNDCGAVAVLEAFINQVNAQSGKKIPPSDAADLVAAAEAIISLLESQGCAGSAAFAIADSPESAFLRRVGKIRARRTR